VIAVALSLLYLTVTGALGVALLWRAARRVFGPLELVAYGAPLGIALGSVAVLLLALAIGLSALTVAVAGVRDPGFEAAADDWIALLVRGAGLSISLCQPIARLRRTVVAGLA
jgi:hypothetical protein